MPSFEVFGDEEKQQALEVFDTGVLFRYEFDEHRKGVYKVALSALGVGIGDEVITQGFTFVVT